MTTRVCISLAAADPAQLIDLAGRAAGADVVELRLDALDDPEAISDGCLERLVGAAGRRALITVRPSWQGGGYAGPEERRAALLERSLSAGAWHVDFELDAPASREWVAEHRRRTVLSHHWPTGDTGDLQERLARIEALRPAIAKLVAPASRPLDALPLLGAGRRLRRAGIEAACFCMGAAGRASRMLDAASGGSLVYCRGPAAGTATGQPSAGWVREDLAPQHWLPGAERYGLVGEPIEHSLSPAVFNAAFAADGSGAGYVPIVADRFDDALRLAEDSGLRGLSVTMPFKLEAVQRARAAGVAGSVGAANTLVWREGGWEAHNTDGPAVVEALAGVMSVAGSSVLLLGAGGAARAAAVCLRDAGARVLVASRRNEAARVLAASVDGVAVAWGEVALSPYDAVVNATPVGMNATAEVPISTADLAVGCVVMEMIYRPLETAWLRQARDRGHRVVRGVEMFVRQAAAQYRLWTGREAPAGLIRKVAIDRLEPGADEF